MGGLQRGLVQRAQNVLGKSVIHFQPASEQLVLELAKDLKNQGVEVFPEYHMELLANAHNFISPVEVHGLPLDNPYAGFLQENKQQNLLGYDLSRKLRVTPGDQLYLISPVHTDSLLGDVPRRVSTTVDDFLITDVPEIDLFHIWTDAIHLQNIIGEKSLNLLRVYKQVDLNKIVQTMESYGLKEIKVLTWEEQNQTLMWALNLENKMMLFLFATMSFLVSIAIVSGLFILYSKIEKDLVSFWILGHGMKKIRKLSTHLLLMVSGFAASSGLVFGGIFLFFVDKFSHLIMPDIFIERKIPVYVTLQGVLTSFCIPFVVAITFGLLSLRHIKKEDKDFLSLIRSTG